MELHTINANGLRFAYYEQGKGPLVLCLHGFPDTADTWRDVLPALAQAGYRAVAPFMRGYPPTEAPLDADYTTLTLGRDALQLLSALGEARGILLGHDWGAFAVYAAANLDPAKVSKMITLAIPHPGALNPSLKVLRKASHFITFQLRGRAQTELQRDDFAQIREIYRRWSPNWEVSEEELLPVKRSLAAPGGVRGALGYYWSFGAEFFSLKGFESRRILRGKTSVPALLLRGETDGAIDPASFDKSRDFFTGPCELVTLPVVGHFPHREAQGAFLDKLLAFLARP